MAYRAAAGVSSVGAFEKRLSLPWEELCDFALLKAFSPLTARRVLQMPPEQSNLVQGGEVLKRAVPPKPSGLVEASVQRIRGGSASPCSPDFLAVEEPLEIRLGFNREGERAYVPLSVTMRTPGHDVELAAGFLLTEGIVSSSAQIEGLCRCRGPGGRCSKNVVTVELRSDVQVDLERLKRHFSISSSCGVCGKTSIAALRLGLHPELSTGPLLDAEVVHRLPDALRAAQSVFDQTGGLHASALFDERGNPLCLYEDVGRHNALDKLIGARLLAGELPLSNRLLLVSGRVSFELVQKAAAAGVPVLAAVGAPSSLAVDLARNCGMTLLGFVRDGRFNIYSGAERLSVGQVSNLPFSGRLETCPTNTPTRTRDVQPPPVPVA
jgi:FdhD protein